MLVSTHVRLRLVLLTGTILGSLSAGPALAQNATWTGVVSDLFRESSNWSPSSVPSGTAFFDSAGRTMITIDSNHSVGGFTFNLHASSYSVFNSANLTFSGSGIVNNSGQLQALYNQGGLYFQNSSSAGATIVNGGGVFHSSVLFQDTSTAGAATINNNANGSVVFENNSTAGSATIRNNKDGGVGFLDSSTAGNATIRNNPGGSLQFAHNSTAGNATIDNSGTMYFFNTSSGGNATIRNHADGYIEFASSSSAENATIDNSGTLMFWLNASAGNARLTTNAGGETIFQAKAHDTVGSIAGAGNYALKNSSLTTGGNGDTTEVSGVISGGGALTKAGAGTLTLSGANTYTGATTVNAGKLVVNGSLASAVTVNGGSLGGSGTVGGIAIGNGATVAPGNSIGTLTVNGNVSFGAGSTYQVEVNAAGQGDRINASGMATLSGGVQVLAETGNYAASTNYTILTATGGVSGQFASVTSNLAFLMPSLAYDAQNVTLTMTRNGTSFGPGGGGTYIAQTRNQSGIAIAAERLGFGNPVYGTLISATAEEARAGFDLLSGEAHAQGVAVAIGESRLVREAILGRLRGTLLPGPGGQIAAGFSADLPSAKGPVLLPAPRLDERFTFWGEAVGAHANTDGDGNAASLSRRTGGAILGADLKLYDSGASSLRVGVAGGYTQSQFDVDGRLSSGRLESGHALLYAGARFGAFRLDGGLGYSFGETSLTRQVRIRGFGDTLRSDRDTDVLQAFAELGYAFTYERFAFEPFAQIALLRVSSGSATEQGGAAALRVFSQDQSLGFTTLGLRAEAQLGAMPLFARGLLGWRYGFGDLTPQALTGFVAGTTPARVYAAQIDRNALVAEAGLDWRISKATTLGLAYAAAVGERTRDHALKGGFEVRF